MNDLISRAAAIDAVLSEERYCERNMDGEATAAVQMARFKLEKVPVVDAAPVVHARWNVIFNPFWDAECSECGYTKRTGWEWGFCPNCGAKMQNGR